MPSKHETDAQALAAVEETLDAVAGVIERVVNTEVGKLLASGAASAAGITTLRSIEERLLDTIAARFAGMWERP